MATKAQLGTSYRPNGYVSSLPEGGFPLSTQVFCMQGTSPALERARQPFRVRNAITGGLLFGFAVSVWAYSISAVKQEDFDDVDAEALNLDRRRASLSESASTKISESSIPTYQPKPSEEPPSSLSRHSAPSVLAQFRPTILDNFIHVRHPTEGNLLVWGAPPLTNIGSIRETRDISW